MIENNQTLLLIVFLDPQLCWPVMKADHVSLKLEVLVEVAMCEPEQGYRYNFYLPLKIRLS